MQSKNKDGGFRLSRAYVEYTIAKRHLGGFGGGEVFPVGEGDGIFDEKGEPDERRTQTEVSHTLKGPNMKADQLFIKETQKLPDAQRIREIDGLSVTLKGEGGGQGAKTGLYAIPVLTPDRAEKRHNGRRMKEDEEPAFTLTAQDKHEVFDGYRIRRLTPTECERLQSFPDGWTEGISDSQRYKCLGNAVTVNVIEAILTKLTYVLNTYDL
jgi:site-specific DNA-cytosine methylase